MPEDMQQDAQNITLSAIEKYTNERDDRTIFVDNIVC